MAKRWSDALPLVVVKRTDTPKRVTFIYPYYQCARFWGHQIDIWREYADDVRDSVCAIVVDDGSPEPMRLPTVPPIPIRGFRIEPDIPWNWLAARNIGAHHAEDGWLLLTDMDHVVPAETVRSVVYGRHDPSVVYAFSRREHTGESVHPHSASFLMTRQMFWTIGGYDERLSGVYGTDGAYRKRLMSVAKVKVLTDALVRHEYVSDSSVTTYPRKTLAMRAAREKKFISVDPREPVKVLSFPYHEVAA